MQGARIGSSASKARYVVVGQSCPNVSMYKKERGLSK
jgi:hypothetical protein